MRDIPGTHPNRPRTKWPTDEGGGLQKRTPTPYSPPADTGVSRPKEEQQSSVKPPAYRRQRSPTLTYGKISSQYGEAERASGKHAAQKGNPTQKPGGVSSRVRSRFKH